MIGVLGAGSWGTALSTVLSSNANIERVPLFCKEHEQFISMQEQQENIRYLPGVKLSEKIVLLEDLKSFVAQVNDILVVVPSIVFSDVIKELKQYITPNHRIVWATKGIDHITGSFFSEIVYKELGKSIPCAVLSGPSFAYEVARGLPTAVTIASNDQKFSDDLINYFHVNNFRVYTNSDLIGVQLGGVIKNIFAVATGISDGLGFGSNARAALITRGLVEMQRLGQKLGAVPDTLIGLSGLGDMILTCTDDKSRNRRFGLALAKGTTQETAQKEIDQVVEAVHNTEKICEIANSLGVELPIANQVNLILKNKITPKQALYNLLSREPVKE